jgi:transcription antitermination factor NusG
MPLLNSEPASFPQNLLQEGFDLTTLRDKKWWVLHTKPRQEKSLARDLLRKEVAFYLPQFEKRWRLRGRLMTSHVPLFTSYLFLMADAKDRVAALTTNRVVNSLQVPDQDKLWGDLRQIYRLIATGAPVTPEDKLAPGALVEIRSGALMGMRGKILASATGRRFVVQVDFIQRGASVTIEDCALEPVG